MRRPSRSCWDDPDAAVDAAGRALGVALTGAVHLLDVRTVVLGGLYARLGEPLRAAVAAELAARVGPVRGPAVPPGHRGRAAGRRGRRWCGTGCGGRRLIPGSAQEALGSTRTRSAVIDVPSGSR